MNERNTTGPARLAVKLSRVGERALKSGHPWIFSSSIERLKPEGRAGDIAVVFDRRHNHVIGLGLYDPLSPIRIKVLHSGGSKNIDEVFFKKRIKEAFVKRSSLLKTDTNAYRLIFGENDGLPGLVADVYNDVLVLKLYSAIWIPYLEVITKGLASVSGVSTIMLRLSRMLQNDPDITLKEGAILFGALPSEEVEFREHGLHFSTNVVKGHKTGFFLDHRHNRKKVGELANGRTVLDVFSYAGGFSVHALSGGAKSVATVDISAQALEIAAKNSSLNPHRGKQFLVQGDAFEIMEEMRHKGRKFDLVVIDPPSFAKEKDQVKAALKKYRWLVRAGVELCRKNGILVMASCSSRIKAESFFSLVESELESTVKDYEIVEKTFHDTDHPIGFDEGAYLKCIYVRLLQIKGKATAVKQL